MEPYLGRIAFNIGVLLVILALIITIIGGISWYNSTLQTPYSSDSMLRIKFEISQGDTARNIVEGLKNKGLIRSESVLLWYIKQENIGECCKGKN